MNSALIAKVKSFMHGFGLGKQAAASFAPGVIGVHNTYSHEGELDIYFDMTRWTPKNSVTWPRERITVPSPDMKGVGLLPGLGNEVQQVLKPTEEGLGWYAEPKEISPAEFGGLAMVTQEGIMKSFWETAERIVQDGTYTDHTREGYMNPEIPVREIELVAGSGLVRHSIQVKVSIFDDGVDGVHAYLFRLTFENENDNYSSSAEDIGSAMGTINFNHIPYSRLGLNMNRASFENASSIDAFRALVTLIPGFQDLAAWFLQSSS
jgi:hypothetical protein